MNWKRGRESIRIVADTYLLDTHALIWWWAFPERLPERVMNLMSDPTSDVFVSAISGLEIAVKVRLGKLPEMAGRIAQFDAAVLADGFRHLPLEHGAAISGGLMSGARRDPFDRVLAGQALTHDMTVVTRDREVARFGCKVIW